MSRILVVDDDASLAENIAIALQRADYSTVIAPDGEQALNFMRDESFDLIVLDVLLPGMDGFEVCREVRTTSQVPILMLTGRSETSDVVLGLEAGADDYLKKPFEIAELRARVRALLRRSRADGDGPIKVGVFEIEPASFTARKQGQAIDLTVTEFRLLLELVRNAGRALSREDLVRRVWDYEFLGNSRLVDMAVKRLREKVEDDPHEPQVIETVRGVGYRFRS